MKRFALFTLGLALAAGACSDRQPQPLAPSGAIVDAEATTERNATIRQKNSGSVGIMANGLSVQELNGLTPEQLAQSLVGPGVTISNVTYTGANVAAGTFSGGEEIIGFESGIILSSGCISNVIGPNEESNITCVNET